MTVTYESAPGAAAPYPPGSLRGPLARPRKPLKLRYVRLLARRETSGEAKAEETPKSVEEVSRADFQRSWNEFGAMVEPRDL